VTSSIDADRIRFWRNAAALCSVNSNTLQPTNCHDYDPRDWPECWWGQGFEAGGKHQATKQQSFFANT